MKKSLKPSLPKNWLKKELKKLSKFEAESAKANYVVGGKKSCVNIKSEL